MSDKGRGKFLQALRYRASDRYEDARRAFEEAAAHGSGDACWYLFSIEEWEGLCYLEGTVADQEKTMQFLTEGVKYEHPLCIMAHYKFVLHPALDSVIMPKSPSLGAEVLGWMMSRGEHEQDRVFSTAELSTLRCAAEQAAVIADVWPLSLYFRYVTRHPNLMKMVSPRLIGYALHLMNDDPSVRFDFCVQDMGWDFYPFDYRSIVEWNYFKLSNDALQTIRCVIGQSIVRFSPPCMSDQERARVEFYKQCKKRADAVVISWMGCFRRKALISLSRDTATLIAKILSDPLHFITE
jgi:hypothetical protein